LTESDFGSFQEQDNVIRNLTKALEKEKAEKEALKTEVMNNNFKMLKNSS